MSGTAADPPELERLRELARRWRAADPDPVTRAAMTAAIARSDPAELADLVGRRLAFGTAGLRAEMGPGPNRMNRLVVRQAAAGLARHLLATTAEAPSRGVVVGCDARANSETFAADVTEVLASHGIAVHTFGPPVPTPLAAFAVTALGAAAGVVITASHNPAADNGMKVYWGDGAQIVAPVDHGIATAIDAVVDDGRILGDPPGGGGTVHALGGAGSADPVVTAYVAHARSNVRGAPAWPITIAVTSLHGVGAELVERVLREGGYDRVHPVPSQRAPDPTFPTVAFPNPEEPGALDRLLELAAQVGADLALANDPDADRLALAAPHPDGGWRALSGDDTGALLAHRLLATTPADPTRLLATTIVSSRLLARMAESAGAEFRETLTGFKWLCRPGIEHPQWRQVLLYEEALGYAIGPSARDKDGIVAALVAADLVAALHREGRTVWSVLDGLAVEHGAHVRSNGSVRLGGPDWQERRDALVIGMVEHPPRSLGGLAVATNDRPAEDVVRLYLEDDTRVVVRPSGTEPKLKYYCEAIEPVRTSVEAARRTAAGRLEPVITELTTLVRG